MQLSTSARLRADCCWQRFETAHWLNWSADCAITNLGVGVDKTGILQEDAIERVVVKIGEYIDIVNGYKTDEHPTIPIVAVATSASRDASNSAELVGKLRELGVELSVIEGNREAALSFRGAARGYEGENLLVADIGGGSTEVVMGVGGKEACPVPIPLTLGVVA